MPSLISGGFSVLGGGVVDRILFFGLAVLLGRVLGPAGYGLYILAYGLLLLAERIVCGGFSRGLVRYVAEHRANGDLEHAKGTMISAVVSAMLLGLLLGALSILFARPLATRVFSKPELTLPLQLFGVGLPFLIVARMSAGVVRAHHRIRAFVVQSSLVLPGLIVSCTAAAVLAAVTLPAVASGTLAAIILSAGAGTFLVRRCLSSEYRSVRARFETRRLVRFSLPMCFVGLASYALTQTDRLMLGALRSASEVGLYGAASRIAIQVGFFGTAFAVVYAPIAAQLHASGKTRELHEQYRLASRWMFLLGLPFAVLLFLFPHPLVGLFGSEFVGSAMPLTVLAAGFLAQVTGGACSTTLIMTDRQRWELYNVLFGAGLNVVLNLLLIPSHGIFGAAVATATTITTVSVLRVLEVRLLMGVWPFSTSHLLILLAGGAMAASTVVLTRVVGVRLPWILSASIGMITYAIVFILTGLTDADRDLLRRAAGWLRRKGPPVPGEDREP